jgi:aspartate aminotransferase
VDALLEHARVAVTPGEAFDAPGFIRISYATSIDHLREGSRRLLEFVRTGVPQAAASARI